MIDSRKAVALFTLAVATSASTATAQPAPTAPAPAQPPAPPEKEDALAVLAPTAGGLTAEDVARRAAATSFEVKAKEEAIRAAQAKVDQAAVAYVPKITLTGRYTRLSKVEYPPMGSLVAAPFAGPGLIPAGSPLVNVPFAFAAPPVDNYLGQASVTVPLTDYVLRLSQQYASASHSEKAAKLDERAQKLKTALDAKLAYYDWVRAKGQAVVARQTLEQAKGHLTDAQHAFDAGTASKADVLRVTAQVASAEMLVERAQNVASLTEDRLRLAMHDASATPYAVGEDVRAEMAALAGVDDVEGLRAEAFEHRLEVRALDETVWSLRDQAKVARASVLPRIDGFADAIYANPNQRYFPQTNDWHFTWDVGVQLTWSPNDAVTGSAAGSEVSAKAAQIEAQKRALYDGIRLEVLQAVQAVREAQVGIDTSARELTAAEESYRVRRELFKNGRATSVELTDAETQLFAARLDALNAHVDLRTARTRLQHALGRDVGSVP